MAITYAWEITNLRKANTLNTLENVVVHVRWKKVGTDENGTTGEFTGATPLTAPDSDFIPYEELTKEQVLGWIQNIVIGSYEQHVNEQIEKQIIKKNDPWVDVTETPWGQNFQNVSPIPEQPVV